MGHEQQRFIEVFGERCSRRSPREQARTSDLWWKNAVVYCLDVETFLDWDDDGIGDLRGSSSGSTTWPASA